MRGCQPSESSLCSVAEVAMCVTSALEPRWFRHSLMSDSSCPICSFPCAKNIFIGICSPFLGLGGPQESDHRRELLRAYPNRPSSNATKQAYELAPPHCRPRVKR